MITRNEIAFNDEESAMNVAKILLNNNYVVMVSKEEALYVVNYEYSPWSYRGDVVFINREDFDTKYIEIVNEEEED